MKTPFQETLTKKDFIVTVEIVPVKGADTSRTVSLIELLKNKADALNFTDNHGAVMHYATLGAALLAQERGVEPVIEVTCRDRNRLAIQADLLFAWSRGITNILCLSGHTIDIGDHKTARPVFDLDSVQLINLVHKLNAGEDMAGNKLNGGTGFCIGASGYPSADPIEVQFIKMLKKLEAGINFVQTQAVYDLEGLKKYTEFIRKIDHKVKVLAGILPLVDLDLARKISEVLPGVFVPEKVLENLEKVQKDGVAAKGIEMAGATIAEIRRNKICDGVHIMLPGNEEKIPAVLQAAGL
jgi:methylenetetrahydrofolate reductase (NADPH)